jgi:hypothetical protein
MTVEATDTTLKATEAARKAPKRTSARAIARLAANRAIGPRTAEPTLLQIPQPHSPPHLMVPVDLQKGSSDEGYYPYLALIDSGATYNFISQTVAYRLGFEVARKRMPLPIATVNGKPLRANAVVCQRVCMRDSAGAKRSHVISLIVADISLYNMILSMAWLQKQNPIIQ